MEPQAQPAWTSAPGAAPPWVHVSKVGTIRVRQPRRRLSGDGQLKIDVVDARFSGRSTPSCGAGRVSCRTTRATSSAPGESATKGDFELLLGLKCAGIGPSSTTRTRTRDDEEGRWTRWRVSAVSATAGNDAEARATRTRSTGARRPRTPVEGDTGEVEGNSERHWNPEEGRCHKLAERRLATVQREAVRGGCSAARE